MNEGVNRQQTLAANVLISYGVFTSICVFALCCLIFTTHLYVCAAVITVCILFNGYFIKKFIVLPSKKIKMVISKFDGERSIRALASEMQVFSTKNSYNLYDLILKEVEKNNKEILVKSKLTEYLALQSQIQPHFLYNTLESIRGDAIRANMLYLAETVKALAVFYRYTITSEGIAFCVEDEIENAKNYFLIQKYRFGDRYNLNIHLSDDTKDLFNISLPKLTLQPIIENAIRHGIEKKEDGGTIHIKFQMNESTLCIYIYDDGVGMDKKTLKKVNDSLADNHVNFEELYKSKHESIGLANVNKRIKLLYGNDYGLKVFSELNIGTTVQITVPV